MAYLLDSDAARKLCQYGLIYELIHALNCSLNELMVLPQLKFQLRKNNRIKAISKLGSEMAFDQLTLLLHGALEVDLSHKEAELALKLARPDIQSGEQILFAVLIERTSTKLLTGDKRALIAYSKIEDPLASSETWGRIISFETAIRLLVENCDFESISMKVRANPGVDKSIDCIFGTTNQSKYDQVMEGLLSYINNLHHQTKGYYSSCTLNQLS